MTVVQGILLGGFWVGIGLCLLFNLGRNRQPALGWGAFLLGLICLIIWVLSMPRTPSEKKDVPTMETVSSVSFSELYHAYKENEIVADDIYKGNRYQVTGEIVGISNDGLLNIGGGATLTVNVELDEAIVVLIATFEKGQIESLKSVKVGDTITFAGKCLSYGSWSECELILEE